MGMGLEAKPSCSARSLNHAGKAGGREGYAALRSKYEGRLRLLLALEAPQSADVASSSLATNVSEQRSDT
jgi:hypothetical protein